MASKNVPTLPADKRPELVGLDNAPALFDEGALAQVTDFATAMSAVEAAVGTVEDISSYGNGFSVVDSKHSLVGVPFVVLQWRFNEGTFGTFVSAAIVTEDGRKLVLNDGSTGIRAQFEMVTAKRTKNGEAATQAGLICRNGLRASDYTYKDATSGKDVPATTFYLAE